MCRKAWSAFLSAPTPCSNTLASAGTDTPIQAAAAVSPPFDLGRIARTFHLGSGRPYAARFMKSLRQKALAHAELNGSGIDTQRLLAAKTMFDFDNVVTAPLHGFRDADDYYARSSSGQYFSGIRVPTLVIRAMDDPFFGSDIPHMALAANENLLPLLRAARGACRFRRRAVAVPLPLLGGTAGSPFSGTISA